jgi:glycosyltransferase involved in cell wall biosynthesis
MQMDATVIIPTYNRAEELKKALSSILNQTKMPIEVIVVDSSPNSETESTVMRMTDLMLAKNVNLRYLRNNIMLSAAVSRNMGVDAAKGDVIFFMDDDVLPERDYIRNILKVYDAYPVALGVEGRIEFQPVQLIAWRLNSRIGHAINLFKKSFFLNSFETNRCRVLPSGNNTSPVPLTRMINCDWLSGVGSYKRKIFASFRFDEKLKRWSFGEDVDFSFRVSKRYPNSLFRTPEARYFHNFSQTARLPSKTVFYKNIGQSISINIFFVLSLIGSLVLDSTVSRGKSMKYHLSSYIYTLMNLPSIKKGDLSFFDLLFCR